MSRPSPTVASEPCAVDFLEFGLNLFLAHVLLVLLPAETEAETVGDAIVVRLKTGTFG
jgi:hypothetical protein